MLSTASVAARTGEACGIETCTLAIPGSAAIDLTVQVTPIGRLARLGTAILTFTSLLAVPAPILAQQASPTPPAPVCMARSGSTPDSPVFVAVVPISEQTSLADKGFTASPCLVDSNELASYRVKVCHLANDAPSVVQNQFVQEYNISPRALCDMANVLAGA